ncbi:unnamed protein product [Rhizophagus irregularis]|nr:unnamed protein product [Rhizophagus irregularis]
MFHNRYVSFNHRQNYIRYPHNTFNVSLDDEENINEETDYVEPNNYETPNETETDYNEPNNYESPNETETDYNEPNNYESSNETETDYLIPNENLLNEILNDENDEEIDYKDYFDDEILNDNEMSIDSNNGTLNEEEPDKIVDKALNSEQVPSMSGLKLYVYSIATQAYDELVDIIRHPQFKREDVVTNIPIYNCGEFIVYKESITRNNFGRILAIVDTDGKLKVLVQRIIQFAELPTNLQSRNRRERSYNEVWLLDREMENAIIIIELQKIVRLATIIILYNEDNINNITSIFIREILYKHQGHWKLRNVAYSYRHPSEFAALDELETT